MKTNHIHVKPDRLYNPLEPLAVGRLSSAVANVGGDIPDDIEAISAVVQYLDGAETKTYTAAATRQTDGAWRIYFAPSYFPAESHSLRYDLVATDSNGNPRWLGQGVLRVFDNPANGSSVAPDILPRDLYAYNPLTGLYHKLVAEQNALGEISVAVDQEGVSL